MDSSQFAIGNIERHRRLFGRILFLFLFLRLLAQIDAHVRAFQPQPVQGILTFCDDQLRRGDIQTIHDYIQAHGSDQAVRMKSDLPQMQFLHLYRHG